MKEDYYVSANFEKAPSPVNWPLIGGVMPAVVVAGLVIFIVHRRRRAG